MDRILALNTSCVTLYTAKVFLEATESLALGIILLVMIPTAFILNLLLTISLAKTDQITSNASNILIAALSVSDCFNACIGMPLLAVMLLLYPKTTNCSLQFAATFFVFLFINASGLFIVLITLDRYIHMDPNLKQNKLLQMAKRFFKVPKIYVLVSFTVIGSFASAGFILVASMYYIHELFILSVMVLVGAVFTCIAIFTGVFLYSHSVLRIRHFIKNSPIYKANTGEGKPETPKYLHDVTVTVFLVLFSMVLSYLPYNLTIAVMATYEVIGKNFIAGKIPLIFAISHVLVYINCVLNAVIIIYRNKKCLKWICIKVIQRIWYFRCKKGRSHAGRE